MKATQKARVGAWYFAIISAADPLPIVPNSVRGVAVNVAHPHGGATVYSSGIRARKALEKLAPPAAMRVVRVRFLGKGAFEFRDGSDRDVHHAEAGGVTR